MVIKVSSSPYIFFKFGFFDNLFYSVILCIVITYKLKNFSNLSNKILFHNIFLKFQYYWAFFLAYGLSTAIAHPQRFLVLKWL